MSDKTLVISERWRELDSSFDNPEIVSVWKDVVHEIILDCSRAEAEVAALRAQNADARKAAEWVPIDAEHLPKVGDEVLRNVSNYWVEGISDPECNGWSAKRWKAMGIRAYRPINALPKPVAFKGFSGNLMVFSDSNLLAENCTAPAMMQPRRRAALDDSPRPSFLCGFTVRQSRRYLRWRQSSDAAHEPAQYSPLMPCDCKQRCPHES